jgi:uncharacterized 2Fe-2S/4Fe-4S cluster protein (DUF4445 family)
MPQITFLPAGTVIDVPAGTLAIDAARLAGVLLNLSCGGKGTCGKCLVQVMEGTVTCEATAQLTTEEKAAGFVYACQSIVTDSATIFIPDHDEKQKDTNLTDSIDPGACPLPPITELSPLTRKINLQIARPAKEDGLSDIDRLTRGLQAAIPTCGELDYPLSVLRKTADILRRAEGRITLTLSAAGDRATVIDIMDGWDGEPHLGIALDLGTTTISVRLIDLHCGKILATKNGYNDQIHCGDDVISRINYARRADRLEDLRIKAVSSINRLITAAAKESGIDLSDIVCAQISGNTVMTHLLLGLNPEYIRLDPYTPTLLTVPPRRARELDLAMNPEAVIAVSTCVGSYVGGDITAGILCTDLALRSDEPGLFIDIGTNGEMVLGNKDFLICCACSAGPAFEGGGVDCGMRATTGAIGSVTVDPETGAAKYSTIGSEKPRGICGSGMIDLIAELFVTGWLDSAGKLNRSKPSPSIHSEGRHASYTIAEAAATKSGKPIVVSENDIENILRAKAAVYSAAAVLLKQIGLGFSDLAHFYVAGGFGQFLNLENAITIGLLPDIPFDKFHYVGNSSLAGSTLLVLSEDYRNTQRSLASRMTYIDLGSFPGFMDEYTAALFLPHTELNFFPHVRKRFQKLS